MKKIEILGTGCPKCEQLTNNARIAADRLGGEFTIEKVTAIDEIVGRGVISTPALAVDGKIVVSGRMVSPEEIEQMIS